jgi:hypothetical protein
MAASRMRSIRTWMLACLTSVLLAGSVVGGESYMLQGQVNSAGDTGLGYFGLVATQEAVHLTQGRSVRRARGVRSSVAGRPADEEQINSAGTTGLGYDGLSDGDDADTSSDVSETRTAEIEYSPTAENALRYSSEQRVNSAGDTGLGYGGF